MSEELSPHYIAQPFHGLMAMRNGLTKKDRAKIKNVLQAANEINGEYNLYLSHNVYYAQKDHRFQTSPSIPGLVPSGQIADKVS